MFIWKKISVYDFEIEILKFILKILFFYDKCLYLLEV